MVYCKNVCQEVCKVWPFVCRCEDPLTTTDVPMNLSEDELDDVCAGLDRILADDPSLEGQKNEPLSIILFKGPTEYATRDFAFTSIRSATIIFIIQLKTCS